MSLNQDQQILVLNSQIKAEIGRSKIDGIGVIAVTDINKGEKVYADRMPNIYTLSYGNFGKLFPHVREIILKRWPSIVNGSKFIYPDARLVSFMNHSNSPNYDPKTDSALRNIKEGEEILEDYTLMPNYEKVWPIDKNTWLLPVTSAIQPKSPRNFSVVRIVKETIKSFAPNWTRSPGRK